MFSGNIIASPSLPCKFAYYLTSIKLVQKRFFAYFYSLYFYNLLELL